MKKIRSLKTIAILSVIWAMLIAYFSIIFGMRYGAKYYGGLLITLVLMILAVILNMKRIELRNLYNVRENWGKSIKKKRNFKHIAELFNRDPEGFSLDEQTWEDLNMEDIYSLLDRTYTTPGEQALYSILRKPLLDNEGLDRRKKIIKYFEENEEVREKIQLELLKLGRENKSGIVPLIWEKVEANRYLGILVLVLSVLPIVPICLVPIYDFSILKYLILLFIVNMFIHYKLKTKIGNIVTSGRYLGSIIKTAQKISEMNDEGIQNYFSTLKLSLEDCAKISKLTSNIGYIEGIDMFFDYVRIQFLSEERNFFAAAHEIDAYREQLKTIYYSIGELDAMIAAASYRKEAVNYAVPEFLTNTKKLVIEDIKHPLINEAVPNSISIDKKGVIITGSNMSGKSTFLRTLGVNVVLAQSIATCRAKSYTGNFFKVISSISPEDNILEGKSYYLGEAEALLRMVENDDLNTPSLCIIDEIFRGTNPIERISASVEILKYLIKGNTMPIVATHDLELTEMVANQYDCFYFTEDVDEKEGLKFDYIIKKGVSPTRNAIKLLKYLGYPDEIVNNAMKNVESMTAV